MTVGIYILNFIGTNQVYIGQSINIEKRYTQHITSIKNNTCNKKLLKAYKMYGLPQYSILVECTDIELDSLEAEAIQIYDSVDNGFNVYKDSYTFPSLKGTQHGNSKYTKEQLLLVYTLLGTTEKTIKEISSITKVPKPTIESISRGDSHRWLQDKMPEISAQITHYNKIRNINSNQLRSEHNKLNYSAKAQGILYKNICSPEGIQYTVDNVQEFARVHNLPKSSLHRVLTNQAKHCRGWVLV